MKNKYMMIGALALGITIGGFVTSEASNKRADFANSISWEYVANHGDIDEVRNKNTGVHYYKYKDRASASGFCPVYQSNGEVKITKEEK